MTTLGAPRLEHLVEPLDGSYVRPGEIPHVEVVAHPGAVAGGVVGPGDREAVTLTARCHHQLTEHV